MELVFQFMLRVLIFKAGPISTCLCVNDRAFQKTTTLHSLCLGPYSSITATINYWIAL